MLALCMGKGGNQQNGGVTSQTIYFLATITIVLIFWLYGSKL